MTYYGNPPAQGFGKIILDCSFSFFNLKIQNDDSSLVRS